MYSLQIADLNVYSFILNKGGMKVTATFLVGQESNSIPYLIAAGPKIMPHRVGSHLEIVDDDAAGHPSDNVSVPDVDLHQVVHQHLEDGISNGSQAMPPSGHFSSSNVVGQQLNDVASTNTVGSETVPQQVNSDSSPDLDTLSDSGSTRFVQDHTESLQLDSMVVGHPSDDVSVPDVLDVKPAQHEVMHQHSNAQVAHSFNASSSIVAFITIAIQYELGPEMSHKMLPVLSTTMGGRWPGLMSHMADSVLHGCYITSSLNQNCLSGAFDALSPLVVILGAQRWLPPPTAIMDVQCGEPHREALGSCASTAGFQAGGMQGRAGVMSLFLLKSGCRSYCGFHTTVQRARGHHHLLQLWMCSVMSHTEKPLALMLAPLGHESEWLVLLPFVGKPQFLPSVDGTMLPLLNGLSCVQEDACQEAKKVYETKLTELCLKIQSLEQELEVTNHGHMEVEEALKFEISHYVALLLGEKMEQMDNCPIDNAGLQSHSHAPACPQPDGVAIPDAIEPEQVSPQTAGQQSNDIPHLITADPRIMPQQVGLHLEIVGHPLDNVLIPDVEAVHQAAAPLGYFYSSNAVGQQLNNITGPNTNGPKIVPQQVDLDLDTVGDNSSTGFVQHHMESLQLMVSWQAIPWALPLFSMSTMLKLRSIRWHTNIPMPMVLMSLPCLTFHLQALWILLGDIHVQTKS
ncbi:hypothetical protein EDB89DRAFT_1907740 [Lactarius sanguifluus]|nr:hypothetical protein EDB89DRAFT_1907740 [Lactarius sanguifluus]